MFNRTKNPIKSKLSPAEFADKLEIVANALEQAATETEAVLDFPSADVTVEEGPTCKTIACHGGWLSTLPCFAGLEVEVFMPDDYSIGAAYISKFLGLYEAGEDGRFWDDDDLFRMWAHQNPTLWGNEDGETMFSSGGALAFRTLAGEVVTNNVTLETIVNRYRGVANRVRALGESWPETITKV